MEINSLDSLLWHNKMRNAYWDRHEFVISIKPFAQSLTLSVFSLFQVCVTTFQTAELIPRRRSVSRIQIVYTTLYSKKWIPILDGVNTLNSLNYSFIKWSIAIREIDATVQASLISTLNASFRMMRRPLSVLKSTAASDELIAFACHSYVETIVSKFRYERPSGVYGQRRRLSDVIGVRRPRHITLLSSPVHIHKSDGNASEVSNGRQWNFAACTSSLPFEEQWAHICAENLTK